MKIRSDFVTNSSSSSYIIAKDNELDVEEYIKSLDKHIYSWIKENIQYYEGNWSHLYNIEEINEIDEEKVLNSIIFIIKNIIKNNLRNLLIFNDPAIHLEDVTIHFLYGSNDSEDPLECYVYDAGLPENDHIKISNVY